VPHVVPAGSGPASSHSGDPVVQAIVCFQQEPCGVQSLPAAHVTQPPSAQTWFVPHGVPVATFSHGFGGPVSTGPLSTTPASVIPASVWVEASAPASWVWVDPSSPASPRFAPSAVASAPPSPPPGLSPKSPSKVVHPALQVPTRKAAPTHEPALLDIIPIVHLGRCR
jgi:hypothetical protein